MPAPTLPILADPTLNSAQQKRAEKFREHATLASKWAASQSTTSPMSSAALMPTIKFLYEDLKLPTLIPLSSILLSLNNEPYDISKQFYPMEPLLATRIPRRTLLKTGRQVAKTTTYAARICLRAAALNNYAILTVAPRADQIRRLSSNYVRPFLETSPLRGMLQDTRCDKSVMQKTLRNQSKLYFSFAFLDCDRTRGYATSELGVDEAQDMDFDFIPIISQCMKASPHGSIITFAGTPKTFSNTMENLWSDSSQAEWIIPCSCGHKNIPSVQHDLLKMIQNDGLSCGKCGKLVNSRAGWWEHAYADRVGLFSGFHIPQVIMPMHWESPSKWRELIRERNTSSKAVFYNEILGESCDVGSHLLTRQQLRSACVLPWKNEVAEAAAQRSRYNQVVMGVDWGGYGEDHTSFTTVSIVARVGGGKHHCLYGERFHSLVEHYQEIVRIIELFRIFGCHLIAHDYGGSGDLREVMLLQSKAVSSEQVIPIHYVSASTKDLMVPKSPPDSWRVYYSTDKTRALGITLAMIKAGLYRFPDYESSMGLFDDWLHLIEEKTEISKRADIRLIRRMPKKSDDFAHACTFASCALFHSTGEYPDLAKAFGATVTESQMNMLNPENAWAMGAPEGVAEENDEDDDDGDDDIDWMTERH